MIYALVAGLLIGATCTWLVHREELKYLRDELKVAHAQIAHAVIHDGAQVPQRVDPVEPPEPLPGWALELVQQWEGAENQAIEEQKIRSWLAEGWGPGAIKRQYGVTT